MAHLVSVGKRWLMMVESERRARLRTLRRVALGAVRTALESMFCCGKIVSSREKKNEVILFL